MVVLAPQIASTASTGSGSTLLPPYYNLWSSGLAASSSSASVSFTVTGGSVIQPGSYVHKLNFGVATLAAFNGGVGTDGLTMAFSITLQPLSMESLTQTDVTGYYVAPDVKTRPYTMLCKAGGSGAACSSAASAVGGFLEALNRIPAIQWAYGNTGGITLVSDMDSFGVAYIAFPDARFGKNPILIKECGATSVTTGVVTSCAGTFAVGGFTSGLMTSVIVSTSADGNTEAATCSNRGMCDSSIGKCQCFTGYTGAACDTQSVLAV